MPSKVLIPVDNQEYSVAALKSVMLRKWDKDSKFLLLRVVEDFSDLLYANEIQHSTALSNEQEEYTYEMRMWLNELTDSFSKVFPETQSRLERGNVSQTICDIASEWCADYIIMGSHDRETSKRCAMGSIATEVIGAAPCSVEVIRYIELHSLLLHEGKITDGDIQRIVHPPSKILICVDLSPTSDSVIDWIGAMGWSKNASFRIIATAQLSHREALTHWHAGIGKLYTREGQHLKVLESNLATLENKLAQLCENQHSSMVIRQESASAAIIEAAREWGADLIVMSASIEQMHLNPILQATPQEVISGVHCSMAVINVDAASQPIFSWQ